LKFYGREANINEQARVIRSFTFHSKGVQDPEYRSRLRKESAFFSRSQSRTRSG